MHSIRILCFICLTILATQDTLAQIGPAVTINKPGAYDGYTLNID